MEIKNYNLVNYQKELEKIINENEKNQVVPTLLLHSCCAPCSSYCIEYLANYFQVTIFFYNPNISPPEEYVRRNEEQQRLISQLPVKYPVKFIEGDYEVQTFYQLAKGLEDLEEGGERCFRCYEMRMIEAALKAKELKIDYFTTTLSISPHKNAAKINEIGLSIEEKYEVKFLPSDFKKKNGYKRSIELSREYDLYRQDYCGCVYSRR